MLWPGPKRSCRQELDVAAANPVDREEDRGHQKNGQGNEHVPEHGHGLEVEQGKDSESRTERDDDPIGDQEGAEIGNDRIADAEQKQSLKPDKDHLHHTSQSETRSCLIPRTILAMVPSAAPVNGTRPIFTCGDPHAEPFRFKFFANLEIESREQNAILNLISTGTAPIAVQTADKPTHALTRTRLPPTC